MKTKPRIIFLSIDINHNGNICVIGMHIHRSIQLHTIQHTESKNKFEP